MNKQKTLKQIDKLYDEARELALELIESEARKLLRKHNRLKEFLMAMGTAFFIDKYDKIIDCDEFKYMHSFNEMLNNLDYDFRVVGVPMRFTANGKVITDW